MSGKSRSFVGDRVQRRGCGLLSIRKGHAILRCPFSAANSSDSGKPVNTRLIGRKWRILASSGQPGRYEASRNRRFGFSTVTTVFGGICLSMIETLAPITEFAPITVSPPSTVAFE